MVWLPTGGGFRSTCDASSRCTLHSPLKWLRLNTSSVGDLVRLPVSEMRWLEEQRVPYVDYAALAQEHSAAMSDGRHFAYFLKPCAQTFPEVAKLVAQLALQATLQRLEFSRPRLWAIAVAMEPHNGCRAMRSVATGNDDRSAWNHVLLVGDGC